FRCPARRFVRPGRSSSRPPPHTCSRSRVRFVSGSTRRARRSRRKDATPACHRGTWARLSFSASTSPRARLVGTCSVATAAKEFGRGSSFSFHIPREPDPRELPARFGGKEVAVRGPYVAPGRDARAAPQDELVHHELAVVFA